jgi:hypothetical protein
MNTKKKTGHICAGSKTNLKIRKIPNRKSIEVKELERLANEAAKRKNPTIPHEWLAPRRYRDDSANALIRCIIDYIRLTGGPAERISITGRQITRYESYVDVVGFQKSIINTHWIPGTVTNGTADISATIKGHSVKIGIKIGRDRPSEAQRLYHSHVEQSGGIYLIVNDFQQFYDWYNLRFIGNEK